MLHDFPLIDPKNIHDGFASILCIKRRMDMQDHQITLCDHALNVESKGWMRGEKALKVFGKGLSPIGRMGVVLTIVAPKIFVRGLSGLMLMKGYVTKLTHECFILVFHCSPTRWGRQRESQHDGHEWVHRALFLW